MKYLYAIFSPLRDPFYRDWLFYVFLFFELQLMGSSIEAGGEEGLLTFVTGTIVYWALFIVGGSKLRSPGIPLFFGMDKGKKVGKSINRAYSSKQESHVDLGDFVGNIAKYGSQKNDYLMKAFQDSKKSLEAYVDATIILAAFEGFGPKSMNAELFGPIWFYCSEVKKEYPASFCLTDNGMLFFSWRKRPNALLDYWATTTEEIKSVGLKEEGGIQLFVSTANRTIGKTKGLIYSETVSLSPRLTGDLAINEIALIGFYSLVEHIQSVVQ